MKNACQRIPIYINENIHLATKIDLEIVNRKKFYPRQRRWGRRRTGWG